jgi:hypothetical protein
LDAAVEALSAKAEGLFLYAYMLGQHLESEAKNGHEIHFENLDSLPAGLGEVYAVNFKRAFPKGQFDPAWTEAKPLVELIAAAREPITVAMAAALLRCTFGGTMGSRSACLRRRRSSFRCAMASFMSFTRPSSTG